MHGTQDGPRDITTPAVQGGSRTSGSSATQPTVTNVQSQSVESNGEPGQSPRASPDPESGIYQNVLVECNALVEKYRKGEITKPTIYIEIQSKLAGALGDRGRAEAAFGSFVATVESHDSESEMAARRGALGNAGRHDTPSPSPGGVEPESDEEPVAKKPRADESAFAWASTKDKKPTNLSANLVKTLELIGVYTVDPKATKRSLTNSPNCPEFPDSEWKNVVTGKAVNLDAVLSGQLSTTNDDLKVEKFGDLELSFGAVEPTKLVKNGGDWTIAWNRTVRATAFAFPHRLQELTGYGEYIASLFAVTHTNFHGRVISYDKAVRKRVGSVRNTELSDYEKFADLKIAHMDSVGVSACAGSSSNRDSGRKGKRGSNWKKAEPCNKWNDGSCSQKEEDCRRQHVCNKCGKGGHKGKDCRKASA
jgi:hypothetical protein